jgi:hypothetical protein
MRKTPAQKARYRDLEREGQAPFQGAENARVLGPGTGDQDQDARV